MAKAAPAPLHASLLGVPKGAAAPAGDVPRAAEPAPPPPEPAPAAPPARVRRPETAPPPVEEPRTALTVRLPLTTQERLREAAFRTRREKQAIVDEALGEWLEQRGF